MAAPDVSASKQKFRRQEIHISYHLHFKDTSSQALHLSRGMDRRNLTDKMDCNEGIERGTVD